MFVSISLVCLASTISSLPFQIAPAVGLASLLSSHPIISSMTPIENPDILHPQIPEISDLVQLPETRAFISNDETHSFISPEIIVQAEFAKTLERLLCSSSIELDLDDLISRMRAIDEEFKFAFDWQDIVNRPDFFLEYIHGLCLSILKI
jgi:hypothetical protein